MWYVKFSIFMIHTYHYQLMECWKCYNKIYMHMYITCKYVLSTHLSTTPLQCSLCFLYLFHGDWDHLGHKNDDTFSHQNHVTKSPVHNRFCTLKITAIDGGQSSRIMWYYLSTRTHYRNKLMYYHLKTSHYIS